MLMVLHLNIVLLPHRNRLCESCCKGFIVGEDVNYARSRNTTTVVFDRQRLSLTFCLHPQALVYERDLPSYVDDILSHVVF